MADAGRLCRKCVGRWVSKVGPSGPRPPASGSSPGAYNASGDHRSTSSATIAVICFAVAALVGICTIVLLLRRNRLRMEHQQQQQQQDGKSAGLEGAAADAQGRRSAHAVELVVMAGEDLPTFLAQPTPTPTSTTSSIVIQCPPLTPSPSPSSNL